MTLGKTQIATYLFVLMGPSGTGKTTLLRHLEESWGVDSAPKFTTRPSRNTPEDARDFVFCDHGTYPKANLLTFESYGNLFGIQLDKIDESFRSGRSHATIVGDGSVIDRLRERYGDQVVGIFVFCASSPLRKRIVGADEVPGPRAGRWPEVQREISEIYDELGAVQVVINNSGSIKGAFKQIDCVMATLLKRARV